MAQSQKPLPYSVGEFLTDARRHFAFLTDEYGFELASSKWTSHQPSFSHAPLLAEHVSTAMPILRYRASMREVSIAHDPRGAVEVLVKTEFPETRSVGIEEIARIRGAPNPERFGEIYDSGRTTAGERLELLATALREYGYDWLVAVEP